MLFSEIHGVYFITVAQIITEALQGELNEKRIHAIVREKAFSESTLTIPRAIKNEEWALVNRKFETPVKHLPATPLTNLQKRWLKSLLSDPRIELFLPDPIGLEDITPLFLYQDFVYFDQYSDGDPYETETYVKNFRTILSAMRENRRLRISFQSGKGTEKTGLYIPYRLEYSRKDDKFRLITAGDRSKTINVARITLCALSDEFAPDKIPPVVRRMEKLVMELYDRRNALERAMLHFSGHKKETERLADDTYRITVWYDLEDRREMLIRVLSFGPMLKVLSPPSFISQIKERIDRQKNCGLL